MLSKHGKKRLNTRVTNSSKLIKKVIEEGYNINFFDGELKNYLDFKKNKNIKNNLIVYNEKIFIFSEKLVLITVLNIPGRLLFDFNKQVSRVA